MADTFVDGDGSLASNDLMASLADLSNTVTAPAGPRRIFVFGSNEAGKHGAGAARYAADNYGAVPAQGFGLQGESFGLPTCALPVGRPGWEMPFEKFQDYVRLFLCYALLHPELEFQVTQVGCGYVGKTAADVAPLFATAPSNCLFDEAWKDYLPSTTRFWGTF
jgi:hypothetical protein